MALAFVALAALATVIVGLVGLRSTSRQLFTAIDGTLEQAAVVVVRPNPATGLPVVERILVPERTGLDRFVVQVLGPRGRIQRSNGETLLPVDEADITIASSPRGIRYRTTEVDGERYRIRTAALGGGALQVGRSLDETEDVLASLRTEMLWWMLGIAALAAVAGWVVADRISAPLRRLGVVADRVAATGRLDEVDADVVDVMSSTTTRDEVQRLQGAMSRMFSALRRAREEQERLVQDAGHELRTPLTSVRTNVDVLTRYPEMDSATREVVIADIMREVEELTTLVNEVIDAASGIANDETVGPLVLGRVAQDVVDRFERRSGRSVELETDDTVAVIGRGAFERALSNLLDNANKFDPGRKPLRLEILDGRLDVMDRGPGIPEDELDMVFSRFHRSITARTLPGSGLGLSIVADIVTRAGGRPHARRRDGGGAAVGFTLPVAGRATSVE
jgi:two-component system sensor histidine kinase MprB